MAITIPVSLDTDQLKDQFDELASKSKSLGKKIGNNLEAGSKGLEDLGDAAGLPIDKLKKLSGGLAALANPVTAVVAVAAALAVATVSAAVGIVKATVAAKALAEELKPLRDQEGFGVSDSALASIDRANDSLSTVGVIAKQLVVGLGAEFAPVVERVSMMLVKLGLMGLDAFNTLASGHDVLRELGSLLVDFLAIPMTSVANALARVIDGIAEVARITGQDGLAGELDDATQRWRDFESELAANTIGAAFTRIEEATGNYDERAKKLIGTIKELGQAHKDTKKDVEDLTDGVDKLLEGWSAGMGLVGDDMTLVKQEVDAAVDAGMAGLGGMTDQALELTLGLDGATEAASDLGDTLADKVVSGVNAVQGGLQGIVGAIGGPVAGAVAGLILNLKDTVNGLVSQLKSLPGIVKSIPKLAITLVKGILEVIPALIKAIPALITGIIDAIPKLVTELIVGLINAIPALIVAAVKLFITYIAASSGYLAVKIVVEIIKELSSAFSVFWKKFSSGELIDGLKSAALEAIVLFIVKMRAAAEDALAVLKSFFTVEFWKDVWQGLKDVLKELLTIGAANTKTFGDAPSMQRAGPQGTNVRTSPGDYFLAGRNPQSLLDQAMNGVFGPSNSPAPISNNGGQINLAYQHRSFDGFFVRHARLGGQTSDLFKTIRASKDARGM